MVAQTLELGGKRYVLLEEDVYVRLLKQRESIEPADLPPLPRPLADGSYPALEYARASLARKIILARRAANLSQRELARRSGLRPETINRIERAKMNPSVATVEKIERALASPQRKRR